MAGYTDCRIVRSTPYTMIRVIKTFIATFQMIYSHLCKLPLTLYLYKLHEQGHADPRLGRYSGKRLFHIMH